LDGGVAPRELRRPPAAVVGTAVRRLSLVPCAGAARAESRGDALSQVQRALRCGVGRRRVLARELAEHVLENPAVLVVLQLLWGVDADQDLEPGRFPFI